MKQFVLDYLAKACDASERVTSCLRETPNADMLINTADGKAVAVYVINHAPRLSEIEAHYTHNTRRKTYTLFIIDARMMPKDNEAIEPPVWMSALHTLMHGRVYAYWCDRRSVTIRPAHMEWKWGGAQRMVSYGSSIDLNCLSVSRIEAASKHIAGTYLTADFGEGAFWKKRDPASGRQYKYSWRQWRYAQRKTRSEEEERARQRAWEEFARHYGSVDGFYSAGSYENTKQRRRQQYRANDARRAGSQRAVERAAVTARHYQLLGVEVSASYEEIKRAYRRKARENHPDLHPADEKDKYNARMADINAAFEAITRQMRQ